MLRRWVVHLITQVTINSILHLLCLRCELISTLLLISIECTTTVNQQKPNRIHSFETIEYKEIKVFRCSRLQE